MLESSSAIFSYCECLSTTKPSSLCSKLLAHMHHKDGTKSNAVAVLTRSLYEEARRNSEEWRVFNCPVRTRKPVHAVVVDSTDLSCRV